VNKKYTQKELREIIICKNKKIGELLNEALKIASSYQQGTINQLAVPVMNINASIEDAIYYIGTVNFILRADNK
jgi:hypothetical protein